MSNQEQHSVELKAVLAAAVGSISVGFVPMFISGLQRAGMDTVSALVWRYLVALSILVPLAVLRHDLVAEWRRGGRWLVLNGLTIGIFQVYCYFKAIETLPTSLVVTIFYCYPILTLAIDRFVYRIPVAAWTLAAVAIIVIGVALTSLPGLSGTTSLDPAGIGFVLLSAFGYAAYIAAAYPFTKSVAPLASAVFIYGSFALAFGAVAAVSGLAFPATPELWLNVLFIGTLGGALQILSFSYALPRLASSGYAVIVCLEVVTVVLAGVVLLGERLIAVQWLGVALVLIGIMIARRQRSERPATAPPAGSGKS